MSDSQRSQGDHDVAGAFELLLREFDQQAQAFGPQVVRATWEGRPDDSLALLSRLNSLRSLRDDLMDVYRRWGDFEAQVNGDRGRPTPPAVEPSTGPVQVSGRPSLGRFYPEVLAVLCLDPPNGPGLSARDVARTVEARDPELGAELLSAPSRLYRVLRGMATQGLAVCWANGSWHATEEGRRREAERPVAIAPVTVEVPPAPVEDVPLVPADLTTTALTLSALEVLCEFGPRLSWSDLVLHLDRLHPELRATELHSAQITALRCALAHRSWLDGGHGPWTLTRQGRKYYEQQSKRLTSSRVGEDTSVQERVSYDE